MGTWQQLKDKHFTKEEQAEIRAAAMREVQLAELREAVRVSQAKLAEALGMKQPSVSKIENQDDMMVGTLRSYIQGLGGELDLVARFPFGEVRLAGLGLPEGVDMVEAPTEARAAGTSKAARPVTKPTSTKRQKAGAR